MADSQVPYPNFPYQIRSIRSSISEPRFSTYLTKGGGDEAYALALYLYNARVAKAFLYPLGVVEVTLRNAIDALLVSRFGLTWHTDEALRVGLLTEPGLATLEKAIDRAGAGASRGQVVSELTFDFWSNLFRPDYHDLWRTNLNVVFPNLERGTKRHDIQAMVKAINRFRNRVAHHEPVLDLNVTDIYSKIVEIVALRCNETAAWLKHHSTVSAVTRTRPRGSTAGFVPISSRLSADFLQVQETTPLDTVFSGLTRKCQAAVCVDSDGSPTVAFTAFALLPFLAGHASKDGGLVEPGGWTVADLLGSIDLSESWAMIKDDLPLATAVDTLKQPKVQVVVGTTATGAPSGIILRAHRRY
ncbi:hypothetical protein [Sphingosinicella humi]|uniref:Abi-like protein n=1 Tax=Allosphingosinicella humi TaxID=2068657 RepID=A0A2U2J0S8_9SPHN|nr:hypothetical protein [Sphingosinicella humi]PWG01944.1 hypothetical protein DF286_02975 [Sphingosinicella humi]